MTAMPPAARSRYDTSLSQAAELVAGPGSATGRYPRGNTGRAGVPATRPMPVPDDLAALLTP